VLILSIFGAMHDQHDKRLFPSCYSHVLLSEKTNQIRSSASFGALCAGPDGFVDSAKMSVFSSITRLVHHYDFLPIELLCYVLTGTTGADDVTHAYSDASWTMRNKAYDSMSPDDIRAAARAARHTNQLRDFSDVHCSAFAIIGSQGSTAFKRMQSQLQSAAEAVRKRKLEAIQDEQASPPEQAVVATLETAHGIDEQNAHGENASGDDDFLSFLGL
jgi:hypothetical protein